MYTGFYTPKRARKNTRFLLVALVGIGLVLVLSGLLAGLFFFSDIRLLQDEGDGRVYFGHKAAFEDLEQTPEQDVPAFTVVSVPRDESAAWSLTEGRAALSPADIYAQYADSVVRIHAVYATADGYGTGFIIDTDGTIVTNHHAVDGAERITVTLADGTEYPGKRLGSDRLSDLAVIQIDAVTEPVVEFGDASLLRHGDSVCAIGNPAGLHNTITGGLISGINRDITLSDAAGDMSMTLLQTDCAVNPGNSGGPLFNEYGQVVGIISSKLASGTTGSYEGLGFAIPVDTALPIIAELRRQGTIAGRPTLGLSVNTQFGLDQDIADAYGLPAGLLVAEVNPQSDAYAKGICPGDILTHVEGEPVTSPSDISRIKEALNPGDLLKVTLYRKGTTFSLDIQLMEEAELTQPTNESPSGS